MEPVCSAAGSKAAPKAINPIKDFGISSHMGKGANFMFCFFYFSAFEFCNQPIPLEGTGEKQLSPLLPTICHLLHCLSSFLLGVWMQKNKVLPCWIESKWKSFYLPPLCLGNNGRRQSQAEMGALNSPLGCFLVNPVFIFTAIMKECIKRTLLGPNIPTSLRQGNGREKRWRRRVFNLLKCYWQQGKSMDMRVAVSSVVLREKKNIYTFIAVTLISQR